MIKYNPKTWFSQIFKFPKSDTMTILWQEMLLIGIYTAILSWVLLHTYAFTIHQFKNTLSVHSLIGVVMGLFLVFRTNTAYDRWWEGRKQWGALVNASRNLAHKINVLLPKNSKEKTEILNYLKAYPFAIKELLREKDALVNLDLEEPIKTKLSSYNHIPNGIAFSIYELVKSVYDKKEISGEEFIIIDTELKELTNIVGACERIKSTPIPFSYAMFMKKFIFVYTLTLPIGLVADFNYWSIPITMFIFYVMVSLEVLAEEIEDPFGEDDNDLPTDEIASKIKSGIEELSKP